MTRVQLGVQCMSSLVTEGAHTALVVGTWELPVVMPWLTTLAEYAGGNLASGHLVIVLLCQHFEQEPVTSTALIRLKSTLAPVEAMKKKRKEKKR